MTMDLLLFTYIFPFLYHVQDDFYRTGLYIWLTWHMSYKKHDLSTLRDHPCSPHFLWWSPCCSPFQFVSLECGKIKEHWFLVSNVEHSKHLTVSARGSTSSYNRLMLSWSGISHHIVKKTKYFNYLMDTSGCNFC